MVKGRGLKERDLNLIKDLGSRINFRFAWRIMRRTYMHKSQINKETGQRTAIKNIVYPLKNNQPTQYNQY